MVEEEDQCLRCISNRKINMLTNLTLDASLGYVEHLSLGGHCIALLEVCKN